MGSNKICEVRRGKMRDVEHVSLLRGSSGETMGLVEGVVARSPSFCVEVDSILELGFLFGAYWRPCANGPVEEAPSPVDLSDFCETDRESL